MKKLLAITAVALFGIAGAYAQQPTAAPKKATTTPAATATPVAVPSAVEVDAAALEKNETKKAETKSCDSKEKKSCDTKANGKKSCCSHKTEAKKEDVVR